MAVSLTRLSWWLWGGKEKEPNSSGSPLNSSSEWGFKERETVKFFPSVKGTKIAPSHRKVKRKWQSREERRLDREYDVVLVPSDGDGCLSGSETDDSDWSIGWLEPHGSDFLQSDDDLDNSFAVLVPCYRKEVESSNKELLSAIKNLPNEFSSAGKNYLEHWLASIQNFEA
ncbi:uncharacterized protein LOC109801307 [Cajanus cajan]|uniref:Uncharacterized protein n=1 Tax=Cajanus cajan TaxID=3821 RepID=A0A151TH24_CAJCA|nr:uncharacterized protein LOC109801307 [Cajanus cajan]XP_020217936.1 uncharacterized protein LOC109801307 [Cajanus cajan]KYP66342.1 hypothetical protein KK1_012631 [Cajanus cajan]